MPLLDHFHPPLSQRRHWDSFHGAWSEALALQLNQDLLPPRYFAEAQVQVGTRVEIDLGTFTEHKPAPGGTNGVAVWTASKPTLDEPLAFSVSDTFEVRIINDSEGPRIVAAIELVSPANKDRPAQRRQFAIKCASYLLQGIGLIIVDVVTERGGNLHCQLLELLQLAFRPDQELFASAYRTVAASEGLRLQNWHESLAVGRVLPTLPLWIGPELSLPLNLETAYQAACAARRIG